MQSKIVIETYDSFQSTSISIHDYPILLLIFNNLIFVPEECLFLVLSQYPYYFQL